MGSATMASTGVQKDNVLRMLSLCGIIGPILFALGWIIAGLLTPDYSHIKQHGSALGAQGATYAPIMNTGFIVFGLLTIAFSAGLFRSLGQGKAGKVGTVLLAVGGIGIAASGIFRCDPGCSGGESFSGQMHYLLFFTLIGIIFAIFFFSWALPKDRVWRRYRAYSLFSGIAALLFFVLLFIISDPREGSSGLQQWTGAIQRMFVGVWVLWIEVMAIRLFQISGRSHVPLRTSTTV